MLLLLSWDGTRFFAVLATELLDASAEAILIFETLINFEFVMLPPSCVPYLDDLGGLKESLASLTVFIIDAYVDPWVLLAPRILHLTEPNKLIVCYVDHFLLRFVRDTLSFIRRVVSSPMDTKTNIREYVSLS